MTPARRLIAQRRLAGLICAVALLLKLLVPSGYMLDRDASGVTVSLCSGMMPAAATPMPGMHSDRTGKDGHPGKAEMPCAFAGLAAVSLAAIDPIQVAILIAFVVALGVATVPDVPVVRRAYRRPPLRGPPAVH